MAKAKKKEKSLIGKDFFCSAQDILEEEKRCASTIPVSPALDEKLQGGLRSGTVVLLRTLPKVGKTTLCMQVVKNALDQNRWVIFVDAERRLVGKKYFDIKGLDVKHPKLLFVRAQVGGKLVSGDEIYSNIYHMMQLPKYRGALYIVDSLSKIIPRSTLEDDTVRADRFDTTPKLNADFCKKVMPLARISESVVIGIQHFITDRNAMGDPLKPDGGIKLEFECDVVIESRKKPKMWDGNAINLAEGEELEGQKVFFNVPVNKMGAPYISKTCPVECYIKFGEGIWWAREALDVLTGMGAITKSGSYYTFLTETGEQKVQGSVKAVDFIESNREFYESLLKNEMTERYGAVYSFEQVDSEEEEE